MENQFLIYLLLLSIVSTYGRHVRIIGGEKTTINKYPYIVQLISDGEYFCAGSIIGKRHVVTAAHCVYPIPKNVSAVSVESGSSAFYNSQHYSYAVEKINLHPEFLSEIQQLRDNLNDIAVLTLRDDIEFNSMQNKIDLPTENIKDNALVEMCGWGFTTFPFGDFADELQVASVKVLSQDDCVESFPDDVLDDFVCTERNGRGASTGDSGGPVISNGKLIAIISYGYPWMYSAPNINTNVFKHLDFINNIILP